MKYIKQPFLPFACPCFLNKQDFIKSDDSHILAGFSTFCEVFDSKFHAHMTSSN